jgi:hypothetical protein
VNEEQQEIASGRAQRVTYYWHTSSAVFAAIEVYLEGNSKASRMASQTAVDAVLEYFYGRWRKTLRTEDGKSGHDAWKPHCLWYEPAMQALPFAAALSDWKAVARIAAYPLEDKLPEAAKAKGETAWGWALITFLRGKSRKEVEHFIAKAEADKAKRPKLLCACLRALLDKDARRFERALLEYLAHYRKSEFKRVIDKVVTLDGTTLYHLGQKQGFKVTLPENVADHVIRF